MSDKSKSRVTFVVVVLVISVLWFLFLPVPRFVFEPYDSARRAMFAHRIADTDRIVATYAGSSVSLTVTGDDAKKVVQAVSSATSDRPPFGMANACSFMAKATFFKGTNILDHIEICSSLFLIHYSEPPFQDDSGLLDTVVCSPVSRAAMDAKMKELESK